LEVHTLTHMHNVHTHTHAVSWMHAGPNGKGPAHAYNGRDHFQDSSDPFLYPTRVRPSRPIQVSAKGARPTEVTASVNDAPLVRVCACVYVFVCVRWISAVQCMFARVTCPPLLETLQASFSHLC